MLAFLFGALACVPVFIISSKLEVCVCVCVCVCVRVRVRTHASMCLHALHSSLVLKELLSPPLCVLCVWSARKGLAVSPAETTSSSLPSHTITEVVQVCKGDLTLSSSVFHEPGHHYMS